MAAKLRTHTVSPHLLKVYVVGLTGGVGSGKSTVAELFAKLGVTIADADQAARTVVQPGSPALQEIEQAFGPEVLLQDGTLDRAAMRKRIFANQQERKKLEAITHPKIKEEIQRQLAAAKGSYAILVVPLLLEAEQENLADRILVVDAPEEQQIKRTIKRDNSSRQQVESMLKAQASRSERLQQADDVIDNSQDPDQLPQQVEQLHRKYLKLAGEGG